MCGSKSTTYSDVGKNIPHGLLVPTHSEINSKYIMESLRILWTSVSRFLPDSARSTISPEPEEGTKSEGGKPGTGDGKGPRASAVLWLLRAEVRCDWRLEYARRQGEPSRGIQNQKQNRATKDVSEDIGLSHRLFLVGTVLLYIPKILV